MTSAVIGKDSQLERASNRNKLQVTYDGIFVLHSPPHPVSRVQERSQPQELPRVTHILLQILELWPRPGRTVQDPQAVLESSEERNTKFNMAMEKVSAHD